MDLLSDEKSPPQFPSSSQQYSLYKLANSDKTPKSTKFQFSSSQQYESHKPANSDKPPKSTKFQSFSSHEPNKQEYVHSADNSDKPPTKFKPSSQSDPVHAPGSVPLSTKAQRQKFYTNLGNYYLALGQHSKVTECQLKIMEDVKQCAERENCSYKEIGTMYWNVNNNEKAITFLELSLEYDANNPISEAEILIKLFLIYNKIRDWPWKSEDEQHTLNRIISLCHKLMEKEDRIIFYNWNTIMLMITVVNKFDKNANVDFLEEKMFSIMSTQNTEFQLKPKDALEVFKVVVQPNNYTKTVLWGSLLLQPFESYNNFSVEEKLNVLQIYLSTSKARIKLWHFSEGLDGMDHAYKTIEKSLKLQDHDDAQEIHNTACFYLIVRLKYVIPCYRDYLKKTTTVVLMFFSSLIYKLPTKIAHIVFVVPFEFSSEIEANKNGAEEKVQEPLRPSTAVTLTELRLFGVQIVEDIVFTVGNDFWYMVQSTWFTVYSKCWYPYQIVCTFACFSINVITVAIRLWVFCAFFVILITVSLLLCTLFLEDILAPLYNAVALSPILPQSAREIFIALCDLLLLLSKVQVQLLRNQVGFPWLFYYIEFSEMNLAQLSPFHYHYHVSVYKYRINNKFFSFASIQFLFPRITNLIIVLCRKFAVFFFISVVAVIFCCIYLLL